VNEFGALVESRKEAGRFIAQGRRWGLLINKNYAMLLRGKQAAAAEQTVWAVDIVADKKN
jgi:hypothetical protein